MRTEGGGKGPCGRPQAGTFLYCLSMLCRQRASGGANPLFVAGKVRSLVASGRAVNISIYEQRFMSSDVSNAFYCIKDFNVQNMLNSNQKLHWCQTYMYKHLLTHAIKLIVSHGSNEVE